MKNIFSKPITYIPYDEAPEARCLYREQAIEIPNAREGEFIICNPKKKIVPWKASWDTLPELCLYELCDVYLYEGLVFSRDGRFFIDSSLRLDKGHLPRSCIRLLPQSRGMDQPALSEGIFPFVSPADYKHITVVKEPTFYFHHTHDIFGHYLFDMFPRFWSLPHVPKNNRVKLYLSWNNVSIPYDVKMFLPAFSLSEEQLLPGKGVLFFKKLYLAVQCARRLEPYFFVTDQMRKCCFRLRDYYSPKVDLESPKRIYISRAKGPRRRLLENHITEEFFRKHGFFIVYPEDYKWHEIMPLFANATHIAGETGSGILKALFSEHLQKMFILRPQGMYSTIYYDSLMSSYYLHGQPLWFIEGKSVPREGRKPDGPNDNWSIVQKDLEAAVEQWMS